VKRVDPGRARALILRVLDAEGVSLEHAAYVAEALIETSLRGVDTHGVRLFPTYVRELRGGRACANPKLAFTSRTRATAVLDAGGALGVVAASAATTQAVALARDYGIGAVAVRNSNHFGAAGVYACRMARQGQIGLVFSSADALVAAHGGHIARFGTNPLAAAALASDDELFCLDMATSETSYSRGLLADHGQRHAGDGPSPGPLSSPLQPLGGYKGQGLAMLVEILCALLAGGPLDHELSHLHTPPFDRARAVTHFVVAIATDAFTPLLEFQARLGALLSAVRCDGEPVRVAGDRAARTVAERQTGGVLLSNGDFAALATLASAHDMVLTVL